MKKFVIFIVVLVLLVVSIFIILSRKTNVVENNPSQSASQLPSPTPDPNVNFRAGFTIFTRGTVRIFSDPKYHNRSEDVYLEAENPNVLVVKKRGITWREFFDTLPSPFKMENDCLTTGTGQLFCSGEKERLQFILNGEKAGDVLGKEIKDGDKLLISFGPENTEVLEDQFEKIPDPK